MKFRMQGEVNAQYRIFRKYLAYNQAPSVLDREVLCFHGAKDYTSCSVATGKVTQTGQASVEEPDKMYPIINGQEGLFRQVKPTPQGKETQKSNPSLWGWGWASGYHHGHIKIHTAEKPQTRRCNGSKLGCHTILVVLY